MFKNSNAVLDYLTSLLPVHSILVNLVEFYLRFSCAILGHSKHYKPSLIALPGWVNILSGIQIYSA